MNKSLQPVEYAQRFAQKRRVTHRRLLMGIYGSLIGLISCESERKAPELHGPERTGGSMHALHENASVLPVSAGPRLLDQCSRATPKAIRGFWTPSDSLISELEDGIWEFLASAINRGAIRRNRITLREDYRQYIGVVHWNGKRTIYVNGFNRDYLISLNRTRSEVARNHPTVSADTVKWRLVPIAVCDGGPSFWGLEYDPSSKRFSKFRINESAG